MCKIADATVIPPAVFQDMGRRLSNWGRWGADDRIGTLNHITPDLVAAAAQSVESGRIVNLGLPISGAGIQVGNGGRINPVHLMSVTPLDVPGREDEGHFADDFIFMPLQSVTQWDGLAHVGYGGYFYNETPVASVTTASGSTRLSIDQIAQRGIAGRGVLIDVARCKGVDRLEAGYEITVADLNEALAMQGASVQPGDIVLVRTGWLRTWSVDGDARRYWNGAPGLALKVAEWLHAHDIAAVASDNWCVEVQYPAPAEFSIPLHYVLIRDMGMTLGEIFVLDELAEVCAEVGRWNFFFTAPPLLVVGGVGSPITPLAIF